MRYVTIGIFAALLLGWPAPAGAIEASLGGAPAKPRQAPVTAPKAKASNAQFATPERLLEWMRGYRSKPEPSRLPAAVHGMRALGLFIDKDKAGLFAGFAAGVLGSNPRQAERLIAKLFPMPPRDQYVIIQAIAYSGLPNWKELLAKFAERMPERKQLIDAFLSGKNQTLIDAPLDSGIAMVDTLWGYYFASGNYKPVVRVISALPWSKNGSDLNKLTVGAMAKWTLAANAEQDKSLLDFYRFQVPHQPKEIAALLKEVIAAAETFEAERLRKEMLASIEQLKIRGPVNKTWWGWAADAGSTAISVGCVAAGVTGHPEIAVPCVITGALYTGALYLWRKVP